MRRAAILLICAAGIGHASGHAEAQGPERLRSVRHMAVGDLAFMNELEPAIQPGYLFQVSFRRNQIETDEFGVPVVLPPHAYLHTLLAAGWALDQGTGEGGFAGLGQLGFVWRLDEEWPLGINAVGPVAQAGWGPKVLGAAARAELLHGNVGLSVGYGWFEGPRDDGVTVSIDLLRCILQDLGLVDACVVP